MKAKINNLIVFLFILCFTSIAQMPLRNDVLNTVKKVVDNVLINSTFLYYDRPIVFNDFHGIGAVILAGVEVSKLISQ